VQPLCEAATCVGRGLAFEEDTMGLSGRERRKSEQADDAAGASFGAVLPTARREFHADGGSTTTSAIAGRAEMCPTCMKISTVRSYSSGVMRSSPVQVPKR